MINYRISLLIFGVEGCMVAAFLWLVSSVEKLSFLEQVGFVVYVLCVLIWSLITSIALMLNMVILFQYLDYRSSLQKYVSQQDEYLYGWKISRPHITRRGELRFQADVLNAHVAPKDKAKCNNLPHRAVKAWCHCGFWAYKDLERAVTRLEERTEKLGAELKTPPVIMRVALYGTVFSYDHGYRAEQQIITDIVFRNRCYCCKIPEITYIGALRGTDMGKRYLPLVAICADCATSGQIGFSRRLLTFEQFSKKHGIGVYILDGYTIMPVKPYIPDYVEEIEWS